MNKLIEPVSFFVPGNPVPKQSVKFNRRSGHAFTPARQKQYQQAVRTIAQNAMQLTKNKEQTTGEVEVYLYFVLEDRRTKDVGNLEKPVLDAMNKLVYSDDNQVRFMEVSKFYLDELELTPSIKELCEDQPGVWVMVSNWDISSY